ncbi:hypothetical protein SAMN04487949_0955 [Halogranum gelatinilyticum]|uniref:DUF8119 domain-containing protein n=1 Tax=Halogranum gelatinilyticum TaxID=660521 RepID=A0A1G9QNR1_9EURY|nr:hypothetical protein [Halogranum gelatinilyticum]SDM12638.1 hypothetical protein SAMN04487949_0955 [Halogranum gelatinilyticum]
MSRLEAIGEHVREHRSGMVVDLVFAMAWVAVVSLVFEVVDGPQWAYYFTMACGVLAYYGFFWSLDVAEGRT